jgi:hypothetical protein
MTAEQVTPTKDFTLTKHESFKRVIKFKNPSGTPQDLAGSTVKLFVLPRGGTAFEINAAGAATQKLFVEPSSTLSAGIDADDTSLTVADASKFAEAGFVKIDSEIAEYTARTATQVTGLIRASAGTTAASHLSGATVRTLGQVRLYISDETVDAYTWRKAEYRFQVEDSLTDKNQEFQGYLEFEKSYA